LIDKLQDVAAEKSQDVGTQHGLDGKLSQQITEVSETMKSSPHGQKTSVI
jgi:hypothetical protein